jgi:hypothetical protein
MEAAPDRNWGTRSGRGRAPSLLVPDLRGELGRQANPRQGHAGDADNAGRGRDLADRAGRRGACATAAVATERHDDRREGRTKGRSRLAAALLVIRIEDDDRLQFASSPFSAGGLFLLWRGLLCWRRGPFRPERHF